MMKATNAETCKRDTTPYAEYLAIRRTMWPNMRKLAFWGKKIIPTHLTHLSSDRPIWKGITNGVESKYEVRKREFRLLEAAPSAKLILRTLNMNMRRDWIIFGQRKQGRVINPDRVAQVWIIPIDQLVSRTSEVQGKLGYRIENFSAHLQVFLSKYQNILEIARNVRRE